MARAFKPGTTDMNYALEQRIRLIDFLLFQYKTVDTAKIALFFGISESTASRDLQIYQSLMPKNMERKAPTKRTPIGGWKATRAFVPLFKY